MKTLIFSRGFSKTFTLTLNANFLRRLLSLLLLVVVVPLLSFRPSLTSTLTIPAGQQFQLGGGQLLGFKVVAKNTGPVSIQARELTGKGVVLERGTLAPWHPGTGPESRTKLRGWLAGVVTQQQYPGRYRESSGNRFQHQQSEHGL